MVTNKIFYFGCIGESGHYLWLPPNRSAYRETTPWGPHPDGSLPPHEDPRCEFLKHSTCRCSQKEGPARIHHKDGWTALSFWDRSVDHRGNSNSNFLAEGTFTFQEMLALAKQHFPAVIARLKFEIVEWKKEAPPINPLT